MIHWTWIAGPIWAYMHYSFLFKGDETYEESLVTPFITLIFILIDIIIFAIYGGLNWW